MTIGCSTWLRATLCASFAFGAWGLVSAANAQTPTLSFPNRHKANVEIRGYPADGSCLQLYTPPSPYSLAITDLSLDSYGSTTPAPFQYICTGTPSCSNPRSAYITAPGGNTLVQNFSAAIIVENGQTLSVCNYNGGGKTTSWTLHGVLYTAPSGSPNGPASAAVLVQKGMPQPVPPPPSER